MAALCIAATGAACTTTGSLPSIDAGNPDSGGPLGSFDAQQTSACTGDASACLFGSVGDEQASGYTNAKVDVFRVYPGGDAGPVQQVAVANDGTFAVSNLAAWSHYYIRATTLLATGLELSTIRGPFTVPATSVEASDGGIPFLVDPYVVSVAEQGLSGQPLELAWVRGYLQDGYGNPVKDAGVTLSAGGASYPVPLATQQPTTTAGYYAANLPASAQADPSYTVSISDPAYATPPVLNLVANPPSFTLSITSPANNATLPAGQAIVVQWPATAGVDFFNTELYPTVSGSVSGNPVFTSPALNAGDVTSETIPGSAVTTPGTYLLSVSAATANCPVGTDGCVLAMVVAEAALTIQ